MYPNLSLMLLYPEKKKKFKLNIALNTMNNSENIHFTIWRFQLCVFRTHERDLHSDNVIKEEAAAEALMFKWTSLCLLLFWISRKTFDWECIWCMSVASNSRLSQWQRDNAILESTMKHFRGYQYKLWVCTWSFNLESGILL